MNAKASRPSRAIFHRRSAPRFCAVRERGSKIQFILLASGYESGVPKEALELQPIAIAHHGGVTDKLFRAGRYAVVRDFVKKVHDAGLVAGISMHNPDNLARIEDSDWENDFYMTCFYYLTRSPEELGRIVSEPTVEQTLGEYYFFAGDPDRMTQRVRGARKPCLGFKILGAGRLCKNAQMLEKAFAYAYRSIKPVDGVIVGMYPALSDEVQENVALAKKYGGPAIAGPAGNTVGGVPKGVSNETPASGCCELVCHAPCRSSNQHRGG